MSEGAIRSPNGDSRLVAVSPNARRARARTPAPLAASPQTPTQQPRQERQADAEWGEHGARPHRTHACESQGEREAKRPRSPAPNR